VQLAIAIIRPTRGGGTGKQLGRWGCATFWSCLSGRTFPFIQDQHDTSGPDRLAWIRQLDMHKIS
jgi:hypothetical protein